MNERAYIAITYWALSLLSLSLYLAFCSNSMVVGFVFLCSCSSFNFHKEFDAFQKRPLSYTKQLNKPKYAHIQNTNLSYENKLETNTWQDVRENMLTFIICILFAEYIDPLYE